MQERLVVSEPSPRRACSRTTTARSPQERERPGCRPVSHHIGAVSAEQESVWRSVRRLGTESKPTMDVCALPVGLNVTASARASGVGDGLQPHQTPRARRAAVRSADRRHGVWFAQARFVRPWDRSCAVSHAALAAVLRLEDVSAGERLAAFSLASFANREHRAWPGTPVAAARAGLSRSQYLAARDGLARRGLVEVDEPGGGRGRSAVVSMLFARSGPWCEVEVNPSLVEAVLSYSRTRGSARVLLATLAAIADQHSAVAELSADEIKATAGMADSTYRRARATLLDSGELVLAAAGGGRARTNHWTIPDPTSINPEPVVAARPRPAPGPGSRPLIASVRLPQPTFASDQLGLPVAPNETAGEAAAGERNGPVLSGVSTSNPAQHRTVSALKGPRLSAVSAVYPGQNRTVCGETPPQTPPETPPPHARAGRKPQNPRIKKDPPNPPEGGLDRASILIEEGYVTARGRRRRRAVRVDLDAIRRELRIPGVEDRRDWEQIRIRLRDLVGQSVFEIWLEGLELIAVDRGGRLVAAAPIDVRAWVKDRFGHVLSASARLLDRELRLADEPERAALGRDRERGGDRRRAIVNQQKVS
jgi:hypothetical protein